LYCSPSVPLPLPLAPLLVRQNVFLQTVMKSFYLSCLRWSDAKKGGKAAMFVFSLRNAEVAFEITIK
jgi:hypothetical protein